jgi:tetratricopeptide (TPR) repeat protein
MPGSNITRFIKMHARVILLFVLCCYTLNSAGQVKPKKPEQLFEEAEAVYNDGKFREAIQLLDECLKLNAGYFDAYALRAPAKEQISDLDGALTDYSIYLEKFPDNPDMLMSRAVLRYKIGYYDQAREDFLKMLTLNSSETNSIFFRQNMSTEERNPMMTTTQQGHGPYVFNYLGLIDFKQKNFQAAIVSFDTAIRLDTRQPDFYVNRGLAKESLNDSTAIKDYEAALQLNPQHTLAKHNLDAWREKKLQKLSPEERLTQTIEADSTMLYPYLERAQQRFEGGYFKGALEDYNQAISMDSSNIEIWLGRGLTREKLKDYTGAFSDYTKAIDLKEDYAKAWLNRGNVLLKLERYNDAIEDYNVALLYWPDYPLAFYNRGMAKVKLKKNPEACADLQQAEQLGMKVEAKVKSKICGE